MIRSIHIQGYRCFDQFTMTGLGRINLLVGTNNSGKTCALEALRIVAADGDPVAFWDSLSWRGERIRDERDSTRRGPEMDVAHLFRGHEIHTGSQFTISASNDSGDRTTICSIAEADAAHAITPLDEDLVLVTPRLVLNVRTKSAGEPKVMPLTRRGGLPFGELEGSTRVQGGARSEAKPVQYVTTESLSSRTLARLWESIALTPTEELILKALKFLDPCIERIAALGASTPYGSGRRGDFIIKRAGQQQPVPIGSMGDGMWRMLAMAISLINARDGVLLVDEIDTGLHYTVMSNMWRLVAETARELNVQVFATTHSHDCVHSLAAICDFVAPGGADVTIQRIEPDRQQAVPYSEAEIRIAAERNIEVR